MLLLSALLLIFKDDIKSFALDEINKHLNKRVHIGYIDVGIWNTFPDMALDFDDVLVYSKFDTLQTVDTAFYSKKMRLRFNPLDFFDGNYSISTIDIEEAQLHLTILEDGRVNYDFLKESEDSVSTGFQFKLEEINVSHTDFSYVNEATDQSYRAFVSELALQGSFSEKQFTMQAISDLNIKSIQNKSVVLLSDKKATCSIAISMDQINNIFEIKSADLNINKLPFQIRGKVSADSLDFYLGAKGLNLAEVATNFTFKELDVVEQMNGGGDVMFDLHVEGPLLNTVSPAIDAEFTIENGKLADKGFILTQIAAHGYYTNGVRSGTEELRIENLNFHSLNKTFRGEVRVTDFARPRLKGKASGVVDLKAAHRLLGPFGMNQLSGNIVLNGNFDMRFNNPQIDPKDIEIYDLRSTLSVNNINAQFQKDPRLFFIPNGEITLRNQFAGFTDLTFETGNSSLMMDGSLNNIADYLDGKAPLIVDATIESNSLILEDLSGKGGDDVKGGKFWILPDDIEGKLNLSLQEVKYSNHSYEAINSQLLFRKHGLYFPYLKGKTAGTNVSGSLTITEERPMYLMVQANLRSDKVVFEPLFKEWNNFDQQVVASENIKGSAEVRLDFLGPFDLYEGKDLKNQFQARAWIKISDGSLRNVSAFKEITESLRSSAAKLLISTKKIDAFEKKLMDLSFETLENEIIINNGVILIPEMKIRSNALDVNLSGTHSFENQIDYSFDFRFREIKTSGSDSEFGEVIDDGTGFRIYLRMHGNLENPVFEWDKEAMKADKEAKREEAKEDFKSLLKSGFGINQKDTTIQEYKKESLPKEKVLMEFNKDSIEEEFSPEEKKKRKTKLQLQIEKWKEENKREEKDVEIDFN